MKKNASLPILICMILMGLLMGCENSSNLNSKSNSSKTLTDPYSISANAISSSSVKITWKCTESAYFKIYYSTKDDVSTAKLLDQTGSLGENSITVDGLSEFTTYYFWVQAYYGRDESKKIRCKKGTKTLLKRPVVSAGKKDRNSVTITWLPQDKARSYYQVSYGITSDYTESFSLGSFPATTSNCVKSGLTAGKTYYFFVRAQKDTEFGEVGMAALKL